MKYEAEFLIRLAIPFTDNGGDDLESQAFDALDDAIHYHGHGPISNHACCEIKTIDKNPA